MNKEKWIERFQKKEYLFEEHEIESAKGWTCCAVGSRIQLEKPELIDDMKHHTISMKKLLTPRAFRLGQKFYDYVQDNKVEKAEEIFYKIQSLETIFRELNKHYYWWSKYI